MVGASGDAVPAPRWATVKNGARALGLSAKGLYRLIEGGHVPAYRIGQRRVLIDLEEVERILRARPVSPTVTNGD